MRRHWLSTLIGLCMLGLTAPTWAVPVVIVGDGSFVVEFFAPNPLLSGPVSWSIRSQPFDPTDPDNPTFPDSETFDILNFAFSFAGHSFDETDAIICECHFTDEGDVILLAFSFDSAAVSWLLVFDFADANLGFFFGDGVVSGGGTSENGQVGADGGFRSFVVPASVPAPGTLALLGLGLLGLGLTRRRAAN
jgi:PEP-CTERM motif